MKSTLSIKMPLPKTKMCSIVQQMNNKHLDILAIESTENIL